MECFDNLLELFLHLDRHLDLLITDFGSAAYLILFLIIFCETGLVFTPFLPGDSLLFAVGAFAARGSFQVELVFFLLWTAAFIGDSTNYWIGFFTGNRILRQEKIRFIKKENIDRTQRFYTKHGGKTITLARFIPIIRTFAPFVAGIGRMRYGYFLFYSILGSFSWVTIFVWGGYFFGNLPLVRDNFTIVITAIVGITLIPAGLSLFRRLLQNRCKSKI